MVAGHLTLKNGKYYAVLNYKNAGGQRKTKWISLGLSEKGNKRKAESELARLRAEFEPPKEVGDLSSDMLFADYLLEWLEIAKGRLAHATYGAYQGLLKSTIVPYFRKKKLTLRELEARHLQMFYSEMLRRVTPNTVIHYHAVIHSALKYAVKTDMLIQNVADKVDRPRKNSFQPVFLSADEMQKMFEALRGTKLELPVLVAAFYGLRRGEVVGLKWDAIDFEQGTISVKRTVTSTIIDGKYQEFEQQSAKTKSSLRTLPLIGSFREYFMQVKEAQWAEVPYAGKYEIVTTYVNKSGNETTTHHTTKNCYYNIASAVANAYNGQVGVAVRALPTGDEGYQTLTVANGGIVNGVAKWDALTEFANQYEVKIQLSFSGL